jgi:hypothetical protein
MQFSLEKDQTVIAHCGEYADMSNPQGEIYGEVHVVVGVDAEGNRIQNRTVVVTNRGGSVVDVGNAEDMDCPFDYCVPEQAHTVEQLANLVERLNATKPKLNMEHWLNASPVYGSPAWVHWALRAAQCANYGAKDYEPQPKTSVRL